MDDLRIKRAWRDPEGRVWYVVRGPLAEGGYPTNGTPSRAFDEALRAAAARRQTHEMAEAHTPTRSYESEPATEPDSPEGLDLAYRTRVQAAQRQGS